MKFTNNESNNNNYVSIIVSLLWLPLYRGPETDILLKRWGRVGNNNSNNCHNSHKFNWN